MTKHGVFVKNTQHETPMGVSQWMDHGQHYGYDKYYERGIQMKLIELIRLRLPHKHRTSKAGMLLPDLRAAEAHNACLLALKRFLDSTYADIQAGRDIYHKMDKTNKG